MEKPTNETIALGKEQREKDLQKIIELSTGLKNTADAQATMLKDMADMLQSVIDSFYDSHAQDENIRFDDDEAAEAYSNALAKAIDNAEAAQAFIDEFFA